MNKNKVSMILATVVGAVMLMIGGLVFNQMYKNHQTNQQIIEKCFHNFNETGEVLVEKNGFWAPVSCKNQ